MNTNKKKIADPHMLCQARKNRPLEGWKPGDRVAYTAAHCRQLGMLGGHKRGTIVKQHEEVKDWIVVLWDGDTEPTPVSTYALAFPKVSIRFSEAL